MERVLRMWEWIAIGLVLVTAAWPLLRWVATRRFRRAFPRLAICAAVLLVAGAAVVVLLALHAPVLLRIAAVAAALALAALHWRARPGYGRGRGLPPGSLALAPVAPWLDPAFYLRQHRRHGPIMKMSHFAHPMICVSGFKEAMALFREFEGTHLRAPDVPFIRYLPCGFLRSMPVDDHRKYRLMIRNCVSPPVILNAAGDVRGTIRRGLERIAAGDDVPGGAGASRSLMFDMVFAAHLRLFIGVGDQDPEFATLRAAYRVIDLGHRRRITLPWSAPDRRVVAAIDEVKAIWRRRAARFATPAGEPPGCFFEAGGRADANALRDEALLLNLIFVALVSTTDLVGLFPWMIKMLSDNPGWQTRLRDALERDPRAATALAERILKETLRMEQSEHLYRRITQPIRHRGFLLPKGWLLRINVRESHRDASAFADPDAFDPDRFLGRDYTPAEYSPFGLLKKSCLGEPLTRAMGVWFLLELVGAYDWTVADPGEREYEGWHWTPGRDFRVALRRRAQAPIESASAVPDATS